ncbi:MAG: hypothetical protein WBR13_15695 [Allosphingosinicella sp.]
MISEENEHAYFPSHDRRPSVERRRDRPKPISFVERAGAAHARERHEIGRRRLGECYCETGRDPEAAPSRKALTRSTQLKLESVRIEPYIGPSVTAVIRENADFRIFGGRLPHYAALWKLRNALIAGCQSSIKVKVFKRPLTGAVRVK